MPFREASAVAPPGPSRADEDAVYFDGSYFVRNEKYEQIMRPDPREKTLGFFSSIALLTNNITGPGMMGLPLIIHQAGVMPTVLFALFIGTASALCGTLLAETIALVPGNASFDRNIKFASVVRLVVGRRMFFAAIVLVAASCSIRAITGLVEAAQSLDVFLVTFVLPYSRNYAVRFLGSSLIGFTSWSPDDCYSPGYNSVSAGTSASGGGGIRDSPHLRDASSGGDDDAAASSAYGYGSGALSAEDELGLGQCAPFGGEQGYVLTLGYALLALLLFPLSWRRKLSDLVDVQRAAFVLLLAMLVRFYYVCAVQHGGLACLQEELLGVRSAAGTVASVMPSFAPTEMPSAGLDWREDLFGATGPAALGASSSTDDFFLADDSLFKVQMPDVDDHVLRRLPPPKRLRWWGRDYSNLVGVVLFNYAYAVTLPAWLHLKQPEVSVNATVWTSVGISTFIYITFGILAAAAFLYVPGDVLSLLGAGQETLLTRLCAGIFGFAIIGFGVPQNCIVIKETLLTGRVCNDFWANFWGSVFPYVLAWCVYHGHAMVVVLDWTGLVVNSLVAFLLPLLLVLQASQLRKKCFEKAASAQRRKRDSYQQLVDLAAHMNETSASLVTSTTNTDTAAAASNVSTNDNAIDVESVGVAEHAPLLRAGAAESSSSTPAHPPVRPPRKLHSGHARRPTSLPLLVNTAHNHTSSLLVQPSPGSMTPKPHSTRLHGPYVVTLLAEEVRELRRKRNARRHSTRLIDTTFSESTPLLLSNGGTGSGGDSTEGLGSVEMAPTTASALSSSANASYGSISRPVPAPVTTAASTGRLAPMQYGSHHGAGSSSGSSGTAQHQYRSLQSAHPAGGEELSNSYHGSSATSAMNRNIPELEEDSMGQREGYMDTAQREHSPSSAAAAAAGGGCDCLPDLLLDLEMDPEYIIDHYHGTERDNAVNALPSCLVPYKLVVVVVVKVVFLVIVSWSLFDAVESSFE